EEQVLRGGRADQLHEPPDGHRRVYDAQLRRGDAEAAAGRGVAQVARDRELAAAAHAEALDPRARPRPEPRRRGLGEDTRAGPRGSGPAASPATLPRPPPPTAGASLMSAPAQNAPPAPVRMTTLTAWSVASRSRMPGSAVHIATVMALRRAGLLITIVATG